MADPDLKPYLDAYPLPNGPELMVLQNPSLPFDPATNPMIPSGLAEVSLPYSNPSGLNAYSLRLDHKVSGKFTLFGRYAETPSDSQIRELNQLRARVFNSRILTLGGTAALTGRLTNEFRFNYSRNRGATVLSMDDFGQAAPITVAQLSSSYSGPAPVWGTFSTGGGIAPILFVGEEADNFQRQLNVVNNTSWVKGSHQLKFGFDWRRLAPIHAPIPFGMQLDVLRGNAGNVHLRFQNNVINGVVERVRLRKRQVAHPIYNNFSAFLQDSWKVSSRLTVDLGVRWEVNPPPNEANGVMPVLLTGVRGIDVSNVAMALPGTPFYRTIYTAVGPRMGAAYQLSNSSGRETVLRGGFGVYYDLGTNMAVAGFNAFPFIANSSTPGGFSATLPVSPQQVPPPEFATVESLDSLIEQTVFAVNPDLKLPYTLQWNVSLERSLGANHAVSMSYVAAVARRLTVTRFLNTTPNFAFNAPRPNPSVGDIIFSSNGPTSDYHALQLQYRSRMSRGLQVLANYTWSHAIDVESADFAPQTTLDRGHASFDVRHNFSAALTYDLPKLGGAGALAALGKGIANGWSVGSIIYARTGLPLPIDISLGAVQFPDGTAMTIRPDVVPGVPVWIRDPSAPGGQRINSDAFTPPPTMDLPDPFDPDSTIPVFARQGTLGRNGVRQPGTYQVNMSVWREFSFGERVKFQFRAEAFNVFNHPVFSNYDPFLGNSRFGLAQNTLAALGSGNGLNTLYQLGGPRSMQLSLRLTF